MTSIVDGQPFREGLKRIADQAKVNLWLDRRVDPSRRIDVGPVGPTVFAAIEKLAASHDCVVAPMDNVVLVGRADWVDQTLASLLTIKRPDQVRSSTVRWDDLTTPSEALQRASGGAAIQLELPHDLWPKTLWRGVDPRVAVTLVLAQFDQAPDFADTRSAKFRAAILVPPQAVTRSYHPGQQTQQIRGAIAELDPQHQIQVAGNQLQITASPSAHRQLVTKLLELKQPAGPDPNRDTFTVRKMSTSASNALQQLAASAGKKCVIDPAAAEACVKIVTVEGKDVTLKELIGMVAKQAGVKAVWQGDTILISK